MGFAWMLWACGQAEDCVTPPDADGDGHRAQGACEVTTPVDCDDADPAIRPGAVERCDGIDNDCSGAVDDEPSADPWFVDADADGVGGDLGSGCRPAEGGSDVSGDCDDADSDIFPGALERCNGLDDDCDGAAEDRSVPAEYPTLADALAAAADGEVICLAAGTHVGGADWGNKAVTVTGEGADLTVLEGGSPIVAMSGDGVLSGVTLRGGVGDVGASVRWTGGSPTLSQAVIEGASCGSTESCQGLAVWASGTTGSLVDVTVSGIVLDRQASELQGGVFWLEDSPLTMERLTVASNSLVVDGEGGFDVQGGLAYLRRSAATCLGCTFVGNDVLGEDVLGGLFDLADASDLYMENGRILANTVTALGFDPEIEGGVFRMGAPATVPELQQVDMVGNVIDGGALTGGLFWVANAGQAASRCGVIIANSILSTNDIGGGSGRILAVETGQAHSVSIVYSDVTDMGVKDLYDHFPGPNLADGNLDTPPLFVDTASEDAGAWDLHLLEVSPLVDAGDPARSDADGSKCDMGSWGGAGAGIWMAE